MSSCDRQMASRLCSSGWQGMSDVSRRILRIIGWGQQQRRIGKVWVWYVVVGTLHEQWLMSWTEHDGVVVIQSLDPLS